MPKYKIEDQRGKEAVKAIIDRLPDGKRYDVEIKLFRAKRTIPQNSLFYKWMQCIQDETGQDIESCKMVFKEMFLGYREVKAFGRTVYELPSTASLNTQEMSKFMDEIQSFALSELGVLLPIPQDLEFEQFLERYEDR